MNVCLLCNQLFARLSERLRLPFLTVSPCHRYCFALPLSFMKKISRVVPLLLAGVLGVQVASAAKPFFAQEFHLHDFDQSILDAMGYESTATASIAYFRELGSVSEDQARLRRAYEPIGCHPFYVMKNGKTEEQGYNCRSFFCTGYTKGPKVCRDTRGSAYGGVVEINRRLGLVTINDVRKLFADYPSNDRSDEMKLKIADMEKVRCKPFYLQEFDVIVGEGYACDEIGSYPHFSGAFNCVTDTRNKEGKVCNITVRDNEMDLRAQIVTNLPASSSSAGSSQSSIGSQSSQSSAISSVSSSESSSVQPVTFPDIEEGKYGYTAIVSLATRGIIRGYPDGTFRPRQTVNRAEFIHLLVQGLHPSKLQAETHCFPDVREEWFSPATCAARRLSWIAGYADGRFHGARTIKKSEALKIIVASMGVPLSSTGPLPPGTADGQWYTPYIRTAMELGLILEPSLYAESEVTRADAAVWMYRASK